MLFRLFAIGAVLRNNHFSTESVPRPAKQRASNWCALSVFREVVGLMMRGGLLHQVPAGWGTRDWMIGGVRASYTV
eukprot:3854259-Rhodomonas_salina.2